jgi:hypothetical protein
MCVTKVKLGFRQRSRGGCLITIGAHFDDALCANQTHHDNVVVATIRFGRNPYLQERVSALQISGWPVGVAYLVSLLPDHHDDVALIQRKESMFRWILPPVCNCKPCHYNPNGNSISIIIMMYHLLSSWSVTYEPWVGLFSLSWNIKLLKGKKPSSKKYISP